MEEVMDMQHNLNLSDQSKTKTDLNKRLEEIGWGLFLFMIGVILLVPNEWVPQGAWLVGAGLIMLGLNGIRYLNGIKVSGFTMILGVLALAGGFSAVLGVKLPLFAIFLLLLGASITLKSLFATKS
jgi:hypothetical protein